jgi:hypothetical protein
MFFYFQRKLEGKMLGLQAHLQFCVNHENKRGVQEDEGGRRKDSRGRAASLRPTRTAKEVLAFDHHC